MNVFHHIKDIITEIIAKEFPEQATGLTFTVEPPRDASHGDISTNIAMVLCHKLGLKPRELAEKLVPSLQEIEWIDEVTIAGPGFINLKLAPGSWYQVLVEILKKGAAFGDSQVGQQQAVNVEYVSANPTGPMHIGHARGAVYGDALASLLEKSGFKVTREYYINDAGSQIDTLARSAYLRYQEALGIDIGDIPAGLYPGDYLKPVGHALKEKYSDRLLSKPEAEYLPLIRELAVAEMLKLIKADLANLGVVHDIFVSEKALQDAGKIQKVCQLLEAQHLLYRGILEPPKGKQPDDWESREQLLFKATQFGDDVDRPLQKSDGTYTYFAADIAYHQDKLERGFKQMLLVLGADHGGYVKRISAVVKALSGGTAKVDVKLSQLVNFVENGQPIKMSKRKGSFTTVNDVVNEVGPDVVRFIMLTRKNDVVLDFDLQLVKEQSRDNPVFYVQYAHARCYSVLQLAQKEVPQAITQMRDITVADLSCLTDEAELALIKRLATWPRLVESASLAFEPHRIAFYLSEVAADFHALWNKGKDHAMLRFIIAEEIEKTAARLVLVQATAYVIQSGLKVLGVKPINVMQ